MNDFFNEVNINTHTFALNLITNLKCIKTW